MKLPGKGFWAGLATGLVVAGSLGIVGMNVQAKTMNAWNSIHLTSIASSMSTLRVYLEEGATERADQWHRFVAYGLEEQSRFAGCMANSWRLPVVGPLGECEHRLGEPVPEDWEIRHLQMARERYAGSVAASATSTGVEP